MFGDLLKQIMIERGYNQKTLAIACGLTEAAMSRYINNTREPNFKTLKKLCKVLKVSADYFISGKELK